MKLFKINIHIGTTPVTFFVMEMLGRRTAAAIKDFGTHQPSNEYVTLDNMMYISNRRTLGSDSDFARCVGIWLYEMRGDAREQRDAIIAQGVSVEDVSPLEKTWLRTWGVDIYYKLIDQMRDDIGYDSIKKRVCLNNVLEMVCYNAEYRTGKEMPNSRHRVTITHRSMRTNNVRTYLDYIKRLKRLSVFVRTAMKSESWDDTNAFEEEFMDMYADFSRSDALCNTFNRINIAFVNKGIELALGEAECGHIEVRDDMQDVEGDSWCQHCYDDDSVDAFDRNGDESRYQRDNVYYSEIRDCYYTYDYDDEHEDDDDDSDSDSSRLMSYSARVTRLLETDTSIQSSQHGEFTMGVEFEMTAGGRSINDAVQDIRGQLGDEYCICKEDGSLPSNGLEIVSAPRGLTEHIKRFKSWAVKSHYRAWDVEKCGMHVHIDSRAFSPMTLGKFLMFINSDNNKDFIRKLAGRHPSIDKQAEHYCRAEFQDALDNPSKAIKGKSSDRYYMVNLQNLTMNESQRLGYMDRFDGNFGTVELRIFRSSLKKERLLAQIEFAHAAVMFCRVASFRDLTGVSFTKWLKTSTNNVYPHLSDWYGVRRTRPSTKTTGTPTETTCTDLV
jgi:hypothetical protein